MQEYVMQVKEYINKNYIPKKEVEQIFNKLVAFEFTTDSYKDLDFISEVIQDLKIMLEE